MNTQPHSDRLVAYMGLNGLYGFMDASGNLVIPHKYRHAFDFSEGLAAVMDENNRYGYINTKGETVIPFVYNSAEPFSEGLAAVADENDLYGYINAKGETVIPHQYRNGFSFHEGLAAVRNENRRYGYINAKGETIIPHRYLNVGSFHEGIAIAVRNATDKSVLFLDPSGNVLPLGDYSFASNCHNGTFAVKKDGRFGIIDKNGNVIIDFIYDDALPFDNNGIASVRSNRINFEITRDGEEYIPDL